MSPKSKHEKKYMEVVMNPKSEYEKKYMENVPFSSAGGSLMYLIVCTRSELVW